MRNAVAHGMRRVARAEASLPPAPNPRTLDLAIASLHLVRSRPSDESFRHIVPIWTFFVASYRPYRVIPLPDRAIVLPLSESPPPSSKLPSRSGAVNVGRPGSQRSQALF